MKVKDESTNNLMFNNIFKLKKINILFGGNGVGKSTFLKMIRDSKFDIEGEVEKIEYYANSTNNTQVNSNKELKSSKDAIKHINASIYSEGQASIHFLLSFLYDLKNLEKNTIILLDEIDSGVSAENLNMIAKTINDLNKKSNLQFFISTNSYHLIYIYKEVLNMYDGNFIKINSYEEYFSSLMSGINIMNDSEKRSFDFLNIYWRERKKPMTIEGSILIVALFSEL